jgi:hypothetical protein
MRVTQTDGIGQYTLDDLIIRLEQEEDKSAVLNIGFHHPHSYRGIHQDLAFEIRYNMTIQQILDEVKSALDSTYTNIKGGKYTMHSYTDVWIVYEEDDGSAEMLGSLMLELLLANREE